MLFEDWLEFLRDVGAEFVIDETFVEQIGPRIYVFDKDLFLLQKKHPRKYKNLYVPYMRLSRFEERSGDAVYVRDNGWCAWYSVEDVKRTICENYL